MTVQLIMQVSRDDDDRLTGTVRRGQRRWWSSFLGHAGAHARVRGACSSGPGGERTELSRPERSLGDAGVAPAVSRQIS